jgi:hypothetical protein
VSGAYTPGPWGWFGNARNNEIYLATERHGRRYVMGFDRWGMRGAQPAFQPADRGLVPASKLLMFEVGDQSVRGVDAAKADDSVYRFDIRGVDCADARLIAAAPELLEALERLLADCGEAMSDGYVENSIHSNEVELARAAIAKARGDA